MSVSGIGAYSGGIGFAASAFPRGAATPTGAKPAGSKDAGGTRELTPEEQNEVRRLKERDQKVRQHEQAHVAAAGKYARGGAQYEFTTGPDGKRYATGGNVSIDTGPERTPEATLVKAQIVRRAALAPADPSPQDRRVAAAASALEREARQELAEQRAEEAQSKSGTGAAAVSQQAVPANGPESGAFSGGSAPAPQGVQRLDVLV